MPGLPGPIRIGQGAAHAGRTEQQAAGGAGGLLGSAILIAKKHADSTYKKLEIITRRYIVR